MLTCSGIEVLSDCIKPLFPKETWHPGISEKKVASEKPMYSVNYFELLKHSCIFSKILPQDTSVLYFCSIFSVMDSILVQDQLLQGLWALNISCPISIYITVPYCETVCSTPSEAGPPSQSKPLKARDSAVTIFDASKVLTGVWSDTTKPAQRMNLIYLWQLLRNVSAQPVRGLLPIFNKIGRQEDSKIALLYLIERTHFCSNC